MLGPQLTRFSARSQIAFPAPCCLAGERRLGPGARDFDPQLFDDNSSRILSELKGLLLKCYLHFDARFGSPLAGVLE